MGCENCFQSEKELQQQFVIVQTAAKQLAVNNGCNVFIYKNHEGWQYMVEQAARQEGIIPSGGIVSGFVPTS